MGDFEKKNFFFLAPTNNWWDQEIHMYSEFVNQVHNSIREVYIV